MKTTLILVVAFLLVSIGCGGYGSMSNQPAAMPAFSPAPGSFNAVQQVTISDTTPNATIYFTTDGSTPTTASPIYRGPVPILQSTQLSAIAVAPGYAMSNVATGMYMIAVAP